VTRDKNKHPKPSWLVISVGIMIINDPIFDDKPKKKIGNRQPFSKVSSSLPKALQCCQCHQHCQCYGWTLWCCTDVLGQRGNQVLVVLGAAQRRLYDWMRGAVASRKCDYLSHVSIFGHLKSTSTQLEVPIDGNWPCGRVWWLLIALKIDENMSHDAGL
jgi:hypothetical protein